MKKHIGYKKLLLPAAVLAMTVSLMLLACSCGLIPDDLGKPATPTPTLAPATVKPSVTPTPEPTPTPLPQVMAEFYDRGTRLDDTGLLAAGTVLKNISYDISNDEENLYEFLGWDANGDGIPEEFPYTLNENTTFTAVLKITPVIYKYEIYDRGTLKVSKECRYGDYIEYPDAGSSIEGDNVFLFIGWSYNGKYDGMTVQRVTENLKIEAVYADSQVLKLYYGGGIYAKYVEEGSLLPDLSEWGVTPDEGYSIVWYTDKALTKQVSSSTMIKGNLTLYGRQERTGAGAGYRIETKDQFRQLMDQVFLSRTTSLNVLITYDYGTLNDLTKFISNNCISIFGYEISMSSKDGDNIQIKLKYPPLATVKSSQVFYTQIPSANTTLEKSGRSADFDSFAVDKIKKTLTVNNSEALFYALENGMRPIIDPKANDLAALYATMKSALRTYVSDDMTEIEKAFAIYQYVILSTVYDNELTEKVKRGENVEGYRGFMLEGVFMDHLAVCDGFSKAFACLCRIEGIECVRVVGTKIETGLSHAWNKVKLEGKWYVVDTTSGGTIVKDTEIMTLKYFLLTDAENEKLNKPEKGSHEDLKCNTVYDIHSELGCKVSSPEAAAVLLKRFIEAAPAGRSTFEIKLGYSIESDRKAVQDILDLMDINVKISYAGTGGTYCFIYEK
ncbi:MAG: hypothetical protein J6112_06690 [Clostridia bacterium]|nr:hypothetical protein [Clostridia bacterium]